MTWVKWSSEEIEILRSQYGNMTCKALLQYLPNRTISAIADKAIKLGIAFRVGKNPMSGVRKHTPEEQKTLNRLSNRASKRRADERDPRMAMFHRAKTRARVNGRPFSITLDDIVIPEHCPIFGIKMERGSKRVTFASPTLDRKNPDQGYVKGNIWVISHKANRIKADASLADIKMMYTALRTLCPECDTDKSVYRLRVGIDIEIFTEAQLNAAGWFRREMLKP